MAIQPRVTSIGTAVESQLVTQSRVTDIAVSIESTINKSARVTSVGVQVEYIKTKNDSKHAYLEAPVTTYTSAITAYLCGSNISSSLLHSFSSGQDISSNNKSSYCAGIEGTSSSSSAYLSGPIGSVISAYLEGTYLTSRNIAYLSGSNTNNSSKSAYIKGSSTYVGNHSAYTKGGASSTSSKNAYTIGGITSSKNAYIEGASTQVIHAYLQGVPDKLGVIDSASAEGLTVDRPSLVAYGNLMVATISYWGDDGLTATPPDGWTLSYTTTYSLGDYMQFYTTKVYYKSCEESEPDTYTWELSDFVSGSATTIMIFAAPENEQQVGNITSLGDGIYNNAVAPSVEAVTDNSIILHHTMTHYPPLGQNDPGDYTLLEEHLESYQNSGMISVAINYKQVTSSGTVASKTIRWIPNTDYTSTIYYGLTLHIEIQQNTTVFGSVKSSISAYIPVLDINATNNHVSYLEGTSTPTSSINSYLKGYNTITLTKIAYVLGGVAPKSSVSAYCPGIQNSTRNTKHAYVGTLEFKSNAHAYIGESLEGEAMVQPYIRLADSTGTTVCNFRVIHEGYTDGELEKAGSVEPTIGGGVDVSMGAVRRKWEPVIKVYGTNSTVDEAGFGTRTALEYYFGLNNPGGTPTNVITMTDHHGIGRSVFIIDTLQANLLTTLVEGSGAVFHVKVRMIEAN